MKRSEIRHGLRVIDPVNTPGIVYTWLAGGEFTQGDLFYYTCDNCGSADQFVLREEAEYPAYRCYSCIDCAGINDLEPLVSIVK